MNLNSKKTKKRLIIWGKQFDANILGCGIICICIAFELAKNEYKTLSVDKMGDSGP